ncbi:MAG TPA: hypothetical protein VFH30_10090 [Acidimicrobiales bacterium]|nr:hypothetical protein [Acidimicrobiales bacterium]
MGFRLHGTITEGVAEFTLCVVFGFALIWLLVTLGLDGWPQSPTYTRWAGSATFA